MLFRKQSQIGLKPMGVGARQQYLKVGQVIDHAPGLNQVVVQFDGRERAPGTNPQTAERFNTRKVTCKVGQRNAHWTHGNAGLPSKFSWVLVGFIENQEHAPVVICSIDDDLTNFLPTLGDDIYKQIWHHYSDTVGIVRGNGNMELVHPTGLKGFVGLESEFEFARQVRIVRHEENRQEKGKALSQEALARGERQQFYESPPNFIWDTGEVDYGPEASARQADEIDHRMVERAREPMIRIEHPFTGDNWRDQPFGSGGEYGANYQTTDTFLEWNKEGDFKFHTNKGIYLELLQVAEKALLHAGEVDYALEIDKANEFITLRAKTGETFLAIDGKNKKVVLSAGPNMSDLEIDGNAGTARFFSPTEIKIGDPTAQFLWKFPFADAFYNAHTHNSFLGIPTGPPIAQLVPNGPHLTKIVKAT